MIKPIGQPTLGMRTANQAAGGAVTNPGVQAIDPAKPGTNPQYAVGNAVTINRAASKPAPSGPRPPIFGGGPSPGNNPDGVPMTPGGAASGTYAGSGGGYQGAINGIDPVKVNISPDILNSFQAYRDAAYGEAQRNLDPQWKQAQADFEQQMVGRGFSPGTEAYQAAYDNFMRGKNDAYSSARNQAFGQGLQAQGQAFGQGLSQSQLANELQKARWSLEGQMAQANATNSMAAEASRNNAAQLDWDKQRFQQTFGAGQDQQDFENLMRLFGAGQSTTQYNNSLLNQDQSRLMPLMSLIPGANGAPNIDVLSPYNNQYNAQVNQAQANQQQQNANNQNYAAIAAALASYFCDENAKDSLGAADEEACLRALNAVRFDRWKYKGDEETHLGTYAQDFNRELGLEEKPVIRQIDFMGALLGSVRALMARNEELQRRVEALENG
ncbi:MAG TPA: hypothetical protein PLN91_08130 [Rhodanobacteraceae bacterium]|nr:hypothetical protein [Rhodanobacteraceae bacterium]